MTKKRLPADVLQEDLETFAAFLGPDDYAPANAQFAAANVKSIKDAMTANQTAEIQIFAAANAKRDATIQNEQDFHQLILGVKNQVKAQYGANSNELQSLGLKKKSDYKTGRKKSRSNITP